MYWRLARRVARDVADDERSGIAVAGIVGIGPSPSCGVTTTVDLRASLDLARKARGQSGLTLTQRQPCTLFP